jgi:hypothetical protein
VLCLAFTFFVIRAILLRRVFTPLRRYVSHSCLIFAPLRAPPVFFI